MKSKEMVLKFLSGTKRFFVLALFLTCASSLADMIRPKIIEYTVDAILADDLSSLPYLLKKWLEMVGGTSYIKANLWIPAAAVIASALLSALFNYGYQMCIAHGGETFVKQMRDQLFEHISHLSISWYSTHQTGDMIQRCTDDVEEIKTFMSEQLVTFVRMVITIVMVLFFMLRIDLRLGLAASASAPLMMGFSIWFHGRIGHAFQICDENESVLSSIAQGNLTGVRVVRAFGQEHMEQARFEKQNQVVTNAWIDLGKNFTYYIAAGDIMTGILMVIILSWGSALCVSNQLTVGSLLALISYLTMLIRPVRSMGRVLSEMSKTGVSIRRLNEIMSAPVEQDKEDACEPPMNRDICFSHVSFGFPGQPLLLKDLNFTIPAGTTLGILGSTGSGKSTIAHLLARLYDLPDAEEKSTKNHGRITVGGIYLSDMKASWVRKNTGFVLQEPFLFSRSIRENLSVTDEHMPESEIRSASAIACLEKVVDEFPKGFDTFVGERGVTLSGGQKQRAAIARTLARHTPILIFDDSLSAVDAETDAMIRKNLKSRMAGTTTIIISHRITTLMAADQILVLENGQITDRGTHGELIRRNGLYKTIYEIQMGNDSNHENRI